MPQLSKIPFGLSYRKAGAHPSIWNVVRHIPHCGLRFEYSGFMDDYGYLAPVDFQKLALAFRTN